MPDADDIIDALATDAVTGIQRSRVNGEEVEMLSVEDRIKAAQFLASQAAVTTPGRGLPKAQRIQPYYP